MKILEKISNWMYIRWGKRDIAAMTREQFKMFGSEFNPESLSPDDRRIFYANAKDLVDNKAFQLIGDSIVDEVKDRIAYQADSETQLFCDRFTINGVALFMERAKKHALQIEGAEEEFDKHDIV